MSATMLKNRVMYRQFIHSVAFVNYKYCTSFKTFVSLLSGHASYIAFYHLSGRDKDSPQKLELKQELP